MGQSVFWKIHLFIALNIWCLVLELQLWHFSYALMEVLVKPQSRALILATVPSWLQWPLTSGCNLCSSQLYAQQFFRSLKFNQLRDKGRGMKKRGEENEQSKFCFKMPLCNWNDDLERRKNRYKRGNMFVRVNEIRFKVFFLFCFFEVFGKNKRKTNNFFL